VDALAEAYQLYRRGQTIESARSDCAPLAMKRISRGTAVSEALFPIKFSPDSLRSSLLS
jgi:hypothetical protein